MSSSLMLLSPRCTSGTTHLKILNVQERKHITFLLQEATSMHHIILISTVIKMTSCQDGEIL
jgi:hypothetical protein